MWPYKPPSEHDIKSLSDVYRPPGHILLSEVVEMVGKAMMGEEWTGEELKARSLTNVILEESSHLENTSPWVPPGGIVFVGVGRHLSPIRERWKVITTQGDRLVNSEEEARALWNQEEPRLRDMWDREIAARQRHTTIARKLQSDLNAAVLPSWAHRLNVGDLREIKPDVWGRDNIPSVFELGNRLSRWRVPNFIKFMDVDANGLPVSVEGRVVLRQSDVERYLSPPQETAPTPPGGANEGKVAELSEPTIRAAAMRTKAETERQYLEHVKRTKSSHDRYPTVKEDEGWRQAQGIQRERLRELRKVHNPRKTGGAPKKLSQKT